MGVRPRGRVQTKSNLTKSFNGRVDGQQQRSSTAVTKAEEGCSKDGPPVVLLKDPPPYLTDGGLFNLNRFKAKRKVLTSITELRYADNNALFALSEADLRKHPGCFCQSLPTPWT